MILIIEKYRFIEIFAMRNKDHTAMKTRYALILALTATLILHIQQAVAQCNDCNPATKAEADFCFTSDLFEGYCASFTEKGATFTLRAGKKVKLIQVAEGDTADAAYYLNLIAEKKLKLSTKDLLFIQEAWAVWPKEKANIGFVFEENGLGIKILEEGTGELPEDGRNIKVHYTGYLEDGTKFDSSYDRGQPFSFMLGRGRVIKGWDQGVAKLKIGTKAILKIPAELGYGSRGAGGVIPPNATLLFEIEVVGY